jgi:hypothetical protein
MSAALQTSTIPPPRPRVTHVRSRIDATALSIRIADNICCAEFATRSGLVQVLLPADRFVSAARAERDANGHPFPVLRESSSERALHLVVPPAEVVHLEPQPERTRENLSRNTPKYEAAWRQLLARPALSVRAAAAEVGVKSDNLYTYIRRTHPAAWQERNGSRSMAKGVA